MEMKMYEDGEVVGIVNVDLNNKKDILKKFEDYFGKDIISLDEIEVEYDEDEIYVEVDEVMYMWNKFN